MSNSRDPLSDDESDELEGSPVSAELVASASLAVVSGRNAGRLFQLIGRETVIGRAPGVQIRIDDPAISGKHAMIVRNGDRHSIVDLSATNGTYLNEQRLSPHQPVVLEPHDTIRLADTVLTYLPNRPGETHDLTQQLPRINALAPTTLGVADPRVIAQLLQASVAPEAEPRPPSFEEQLDKVLRFLRVVRRNWIPLLAATALCSLLATLSVFVMPPPAEATFKIRMMPKTSANPLRPYEREDTDLFYSSAEQNFMSRGLVQKTFASLGEKQKTREQLDAALRSLKFESVSQATYVGTFIHESPDYATRFLDQHVKNFLDSEIQKTIHVVQAEVDFLSARVKEREEELRRMEQELKEFKSKHIEGLPEHAQQSFTAREQLYTRRSELSAALQRAELELEHARQRLREEAPLLEKKLQGSQPYEAAIVEVRRKLSEARAKGLGEQHPEVVRLVSEERELERLADQARASSATELERNANPGLVALRTRVSELDVLVRGTRAELGQVNAQLARLDGIVGKMPEVEARYAQLTRSYAASKDMHAKLFEQLRTSQLQLDLERTSAMARYEVLLPPESSGAPIRSALRKRTAVGVALGLMLGAVIAGARELSQFVKRRRRRTFAIVPAPQQ